jgi:hypothetical protein
MPYGRADDYGGGLLRRLPVVTRASGHGEPFSSMRDLALSYHHLLASPVTATSGLRTPGGFRARLDHSQ